MDRTFYCPRSSLVAIPVLIWASGRRFTTGMAGRRRREGRMCDPFCNDPAIPAKAAITLVLVQSAEEDILQVQGSDHGLRRGWSATTASTRRYKLEKKIFFKILRTEVRFNLCTWLGEIYSCSCLTVLPGPAWYLLGSCLTRSAKIKSHLCRVQCYPIG